MRTLKLTTMAAIMAFMSTAAFAVNPKTTDSKTDAKGTVEAAVSPAETKTADATAYFQYNGPQPPASGDLDDPDNYSDSQVNPDALCPTSGVYGCAAQFTISGNTHSGNPSDIRQKNTN